MISLQVTPNAGRINLSQGTPTTWWAPTVCLYSLTTSEEGDSWSVTERQSVSGEHDEALPPSLLFSAPLYEGVILFTCFVDNCKTESLFAWRTRRAPPPGAESPQNSFLLFLFWCLKACQIWNGQTKSLLNEKNAWPVPQTNWNNPIWHLSKLFNKNQKRQFKWRKKINKLF